MIIGGKLITNLDKQAELLFVMSAAMLTMTMEMAKINYAWNN
jgi:hypothetical protein